MLLPGYRYRGDLVGETRSGERSFECLPPHLGVRLAVPPVPITWWGALPEAMTRPSICVDNNDLRCLRRTVDACYQR